MTDDDDIQEYARPCPNCEYHRKRAQRWRDEAYKQAGHPLPEREQEPVAFASHGVVNWIADKQFMHEAALYERPTQQEPVACKECHLKDLVYDLLGELKVANLKLSVRAQRTWVGLTYEEQRELYKKHEMDGWGHFYNAIEAKLKEKNYG